MSYYRLYVSDHLGKHIAAVFAFEAADDGAAIRMARAKRINQRCQLWNRGRRVIDIIPIGRGGS